MAPIWTSGLGGMGGFDRQVRTPSGGKPDMTPQLLTRMKELEHQVGRLTLLNQAMWELVRDRAKLTDADMEAKIREVDLRDGVEDGAITNTAMQCPSCGRVSGSRHYKCLYCGLEFEKPVIG